MEITLQGFKSLKKYEFFMKLDDLKPQRFFSSAELIKNSSYYFVLPNQRKYLEREYLHKSGLYRIIQPLDTTSSKIEKIQESAR